MSEPVVVDSPEASPVEAGGISIRDELRANEAGRGRSVEAGSIGDQLRAGRKGAEPVAAEPVSPEQMEAEDRELIAGLGVDEAELSRFVEANPDVANLLPEPKSKDDLARNIVALTELMVGRNARQVVAATDKQQAVEAAMHAVLDGDTSMDAHLALNDLVGKVGLDAPETADALGFWLEQDPDGAQQWFASTVANAEQAYAAQTFEEHQRQLDQVAVDSKAMHDAIAKAVPEFERSHPGAEKYTAAMVELAQESGIDLASDPESLPEKLNTLFEAVYQLDPSAQPEKLRDGSVRKSAAWEQDQQARMLAWSIPGRDAELPAYDARLKERGYYREGNKVLPLNPPTIDGATISRHAQPQSHAEWERTERARMTAAWARPSIRDELHGPRRSIMAAPDSAARAEPPADPDDPGGYWQTQRSYGNI